MNFRLPLPMNRCAKWIADLALARHRFATYALLSLGYFAGGLMGHAEVVDVTQPGDPIVAIGNGSPANQGVEKAIDNTTAKHLNFGSNASVGAPPYTAPGGFIVTPSVGSTIVQAIRIYPADDVSARDPANYTFEGSRNGTTYTLISSGPISMPAARNLAGLPVNDGLPFLEVPLPYKDAYTSYRFTVNSVRTPASANSFQVAEVELMGLPASEGIVVTTTVDEDDGTPDPTVGTGTSLREAINLANSRPQDDTIVFSEAVFAAPRKTIMLNGTELPTLTDGYLSIVGPAAGVAIDAHKASRIFQVQTYASFSRLTIRNGHHDQDGGGLASNGGVVIMDSCTFEGNDANRGGAIFHNSGLAQGIDANLKLRNCTISGNGAYSGAGICNAFGLIAIDSCTIAENEATGFGGGIYHLLQGNGILTKLKNSIVAKNRAAGSRNDLQAGLIQSEGYNLVGVGHGTANFNQTGDQIIEPFGDPRLGPLAENGGPARTHALLADCPARETGSTSLIVDQRGVSRPQALLKDKGAFEYNTGTTGISLKVTTLADEDDGTSDPSVGAGTSLREAINYANASGGADTITFDHNVFGAPRQTITLGGTQLPAIISELTISAPFYGVEISGNNTSRVFDVASTGNATFSGLTIRNGNPGTIQSGGGIRVVQGKLALVACTLTGNTGASGGALSLSIGATIATLTNCTIVGNTTTDQPGAIQVLAGIVSVDSCTVVNNTGGGMRTHAGVTAQVRNSIISVNTGGDVILDAGAGTGTFQSLASNLVGFGSGVPAFNQPTDVKFNSNPRLLPLADNGGKTQTCAMHPDSPAKDFGGTALKVDQRGTARPQNFFDDKGAFELVVTESPVVTTTADENDGTSDPDYGTGTSLREAINYAYRAGAPITEITFDPIVFAAPRKTITLSGSLFLLTIYGVMSITAPPAGVEISGNDGVQVFNNYANTTMTGLTIRNGRNTADGGGIVNRGALLVDRCTFVNNSARSGGAIWSELDTAFNAKLTVRNSTFTGNTASIAGGGICNAQGQSRIESCTITGNTAPVNAGSGLAASGVAGSFVEVKNSIIAGNTNTDVDNYNGPQILLQSLGNNLVGDGQVVFIVFAGDRQIGNGSPGLGPLQDNGGPTPTRAVQLGSPAINTGNSNLTVDQRGAPRPRGGADEIGAYELAAIEIVQPTLSNGLVGQLYPARNFGTSGGVSPITYSLQSGYLPPGLTLTSSGVLSGTPRSAGVYHFNVRGIDAEGSPGNITCDLTIGGVSAPLAGAIAVWYRAEGDAASFAGAPGTIGGTVGFAPGKVGQAFSFSGGPGYVALEQGLFPVPTTGTSTTPFSFETWFSTTGSGVILGQQGSSIAPYGTALGTIPAIYVGTDGKLRVEMFWTGAINQVASTATVNDGNFHHLAAVFDGTNLIAYLDGAAIGTRPVTQVGYSTSYFYQLGTGYSPGNRPSLATGWRNFTGLIDETAIYRHALTAAEVQAIYGAGSKGKSTMPSFTSIARSSNNFTLGLKAWPSLRYQLQFSETLLPADYSDTGIVVTSDANGLGTFSATVTPFPPTGFFRAIEVP